MGRWLIKFNRYINETLYTEAKGKVFLKKLSKIINWMKRNLTQMIYGLQKLDDINEKK